MRTIKEHMESMEDTIKDGILKGPSLGQQDMHFYSRLAAQYNTMEQIKDIKEFLVLEFDKEESEENQIEILTTQSESDS